jgi:hypothetical protein
MAWVESFHDALVASNLGIGASASVTNATTTIVRKGTIKEVGNDRGLHRTVVPLTKHHGALCHSVCRLYWYLSW